MITRLLFCFFALAVTATAQKNTVTPASADLKQINCGNLVYAANQTSVCFADAFLGKTAEQTSLEVNPRFVRVGLDTPELFDFPFLVWSGENNFSLTDKQRQQLRKYLLGGGFILASPGCSDAKWNTCMRREIKLAFPELEMERIPMEHAIFSTVHQVSRLHNKQRSQVFVEGLSINGRLGLVYSHEGLNDVKNAKGCCCCGGNEIRESQQVNINILTYALLY